MSAQEKESKSQLYRKAVQRGDKQECKCSFRIKMVLARASIAKIEGRK